MVWPSLAIDCVRAAEMSEKLLLTAAEEITVPPTNAAWGKLWVPFPSLAIGYLLKVG